MLKILSLIGFFSIVSFSANAAAPTLLKEYGDWSAYYYQDSQGIVCYMASTPKKDEGKYSKRGDIYVAITHRPKEKSFDVVNFVAGYTYKSGEKIEVKIGNKTISNLFTSGDKAWALNDSVDKELVDAMKKGERMIVHGTSNKGNASKDTYSLKGFLSAYKAISAKCPRK